MRRTTPPVLKDSRISCLVTTMPLVSMGGTAEPWLAACTRTGVGFGASGASLRPQPVRIVANTAAAAAAFRSLLVRMGWIQGQRARGGGVVELGLAGQYLETRDIEIELGAGEA